MRIKRIDRERGFAEVEGDPIPKGAQAIFGPFVRGMKVTGIMLLAGDIKELPYSTLVVVFDNSIEATFELKTLVASPFRDRTCQ